MIYCIIKKKSSYLKNFNGLTGNVNWTRKKKDAIQLPYPPVVNTNVLELCGDDAELLTIDKTVNKK